MRTPGEVPVDEELLEVAISFGLVNIPVRLYTATQEKQARFNQLHKVCGTPIRYRKTCPHCEAEVDQNEIVRGYEYLPGQYVTLTEEDMASLPLPTLRAIEILDFVDGKQIDPIYYAKSYYIEPVEGAGKAYTLLRTVLERAKKTGMAKVALRQKESLAAVRVYGDLLLLSLMLYPDEIRSPEGLARGAAEEEIGDREMEMAERLVDSLSVDFNPESYTDAYRKALADLIEEKAAGGELTRPAEPDPQKRWRASWPRWKPASAKPGKIETGSEPSPVRARANDGGPMPGRSNRCWPSPPSLSTTMSSSSNPNGTASAASPSSTVPCGCKAGGRKTSPPLSPNLSGRRPPCPPPGG